MMLTNEEMAVIKAYRKMDNVDRVSIRRILGLDKTGLRHIANIEDYKNRKNPSALNKSCHGSCHTSKKH